MSEVKYNLPDDIDTLTEQDVKGKKVLLRVDFNTPIGANGEVADATKIEASLPTINRLLEMGANIALVSHLGRPKGKGFESEFTMKPVAKKLQEFLKREVVLTEDIVLRDSDDELINNLNAGKVVLFENSRFHPGEEGKGEGEEREEEYEKLCRHFACVFDGYCNDAFGTAHRDHATTAGVAKYLPLSKWAVMGYLMRDEEKVLTEVKENPEKPLMYILGGSKVKDKVELIENIVGTADTIAIGGAMAFTFMAYDGKKIGSYVIGDKERQLITDGTVENIIKKVEKTGIDLFYADDHVITKKEALDKQYQDNNKSFEGLEIETEKTEGVDIKEEYVGIDIGEKTVNKILEKAKQSKTIIFNGSQGIYESEDGAKGTIAVAKGIADCGAKVIVGGGDAVAAINKAGVSDKMYHISTGGGATLEFLSGKILPGIQVLLDRAKKKDKTENVSKEPELSIL